MSIFEELDISLNKSELITLVGAGGKTTTMFTLANELRQAGKSVLVTTTTAIYHPSKNEYDAIEITGKYTSSIFKKIKPASINVLGSRISEEGKLIGLDSEIINNIFLRNIFDFIIVEGDGSKGKPIKAPAEHEPVIPSLSTKVIGVIGLDSLGKKINSENVHRPELFCHITNSNMGDIIDEEKVLLLIKNNNGLFKEAPYGVHKYLKLNKVDEIKGLKAAEFIERKIIQEGINIDKVIIGRIKEVY